MTVLRTLAKGLAHAWRACLPVLPEWRDNAPAPEPYWEDRRDCYVSAHRLRELGFLIIFGGLTIVALTALGELLSPIKAPTRVIGISVGISVFVVIASAIAFMLGRAIQLAVAEVPPDLPRGWLRSRERALSLARINADGRIFLAIYRVPTALAYLAVPVSILRRSVLYGNPFSNGDIIFSERTIALVVSGVQPYAAGVLSLLTLGSVALVSSAYKELSVLRVEREHWAAPPSPPAGLA